jgi:hypothetical protein
MEQNIQSGNMSKMVFTLSKEEKSSMEVHHSVLTRTRSSSRSSSLVHFSKDNYMNPTHSPKLTRLNAGLAIFARRQGSVFLQRSKRYI